MRVTHRQTVLPGLDDAEIFLLTDGGDPHLNEIQLRNLKKLCGGRTAIHVIHFGRAAQPEPDNFLMVLARQNNGGYTYVRMAIGFGQHAPTKSD